MGVKEEGGGVRAMFVLMIFLRQRQFVAGMTR